MVDAACEYRCRVVCSLPRTQELELGLIAWFSSKHAHAQGSSNSPRLHYSVVPVHLPWCDASLMSHSAARNSSGVVWVSSHLTKMPTL